MDPNMAFGMRLSLDRVNVGDRLQKEQLTHRMRMNIIIMRTLWLD